MNDEALILVRDFLAAVDDAIGRLYIQFGKDRVRAGPNIGFFSRQGTLVDGSEYMFHGYGCAVNLNGVDVKFDFAFNGRYDGFDPWRLWSFAKQQPDQYASFKKLESVEIAIRRLLAEGKIVHSEDASRQMFFLADSPPRYL